MPRLQRVTCHRYGRADCDCNSLVLARLIAAEGAFAYNNNVAYVEFECCVGAVMSGAPGATKLKVFISYSRADEDFADELKLGVEDKGYTVEIDKHSIRQGEDWKARLTKLIAACDTVVFVLSPDSARSSICHWEVDEAHRQAKRIVPILYRGLHEAPRGRQTDGNPWPEGPTTAPERLSLLNYPRFDGGRSFITALRGLVQALEDDLPWIEGHSRLAMRARDWDEGGRATNRLMSGPDIVDAKALVAKRKVSAPPMLPVQLDFIQSSEVHAAAQQSDRERDLEERRRLAEAALIQSRRLVARTRLGLAAALSLLVLAFGLGWVAWSQREQARLAATAAEETAREAQLTRSGLLASAARGLNDGAPSAGAPIAALLALEALPDSMSEDPHQAKRPEMPYAVAQLYRAYHHHRERVVLPWQERAFWSPDGQYLLITSSMTASILDRQSGARKVQFVQDEKVDKIAWTRDERTLAISSGEFDWDYYTNYVYKDVGEVRIFNLAVGREVRRFANLTYVYALSWSPDGSVLAMAFSNGVRLFDANSDRELPSLATSTRAFKLSWSHDGRLLATSGDGYVRVYDVRGRELTALKHEKRVPEILFSSGNTRLVTMSSDASKSIVKAFDGATGIEYAAIAIDSYARAVAWSPDDRFLAVGSDDRVTRIFEASSGREVAKLSHGATVWSLAWSPNGAFLAAASGGRLHGEVQIYAVGTWREHSRMSHDLTVDNVTWRHDSQQIMTVSRDKTARLFDVHPSREVNAQDVYLRRILLRPDGARLAMNLTTTGGVQKGEVRILEMKTQRELLRLMHDGAIRDLAWGGDGRLATGAADKLVRIFSPDGGAISAITHGSEVNAVAWSPDGQRLATAAGTYVSVVDASTGRFMQRHVLEGIVYSLSWSPDGRLLATGGGGQLRARVRSR